MQQTKLYTFVEAIYQLKFYVTRILYVSGVTSWTKFGSRSLGGILDKNQVLIK